MKQFRILLTAALLGLTAGPLLGMQPRKKGPFQTVQQLDTKNRAISDANKNAHQNRPYFTLFLMEPAYGYKTLNACVDSLFWNKKFPKRYNKTADSKWHFSMMVFAVPFKGAPNREEVVHAANALRNTLIKHKDTLKKITFTFKSLESIGTNQFIAAHYKFKTGKWEFLNSYTRIVDKFLKKYNKAWMVYGYKVIVPHVSVAKTANPGGKVVIDSSSCAQINDWTFGRNFHVDGSYYDPKAQKTIKIKTEPF